MYKICFVALTKILFEFRLESNLQCWVFKKDATVFTHKPKITSDGLVSEKISYFIIFVYMYIRPTTVHVMYSIVEPCYSKPLNCSHLAITAKSSGID